MDFVAPGTKIWSYCEPCRIAIITETIYDFVTESTTHSQDEMQMCYINVQIGLPAIWCQCGKLET